MSIEIKPAPSTGELPTPGPGRIAVFKDHDGRYMTKDETGHVRPATREDFAAWPPGVPNDFDESNT